MAAKGVIYLRCGGDAWYATHSDPAVYVAFGTATIPTAYTPQAEPDHVLREIARLNPDAVVRLARVR